MDRTSMLKQFLEENPRDAFARYGLALEYANSGNAESALEEFERLLDFNPDYVPGYQMAAHTLMRSGRNNEARKMLADGIACATRTGNQHARSEMEGMLAELG